MEEIKKPIRVSYSSIEKYKMCNKSYDLHYNKRLRSLRNSSALIFGNALDQAFNCLLIRKVDNPNEEDATFLLRIPEEVFIENMHNNDVDYFKSDLDVDLLSEEELLLSESEQSYLSLIKKGKLFLKAYEAEIMPRIHKVRQIQTTKETVNDDGDILTTKLDFIADWETEGNTVLFDNKTSARKYSQESVKDSNQLAMYGEIEGLSKCGYIVCIKNMKKIKSTVCKECSATFGGQMKSCKTKGCFGELELKIDIVPEIQVIIDDISNEISEIVFDDISRHVYNIKDGRFDHNWDSCFQFGRKCPYFDYCRSGSMQGLKDLNNKDNF